MKKTFKQWPVLLAAGALVVAPLLNPIVAQAAPATVPTLAVKDKPGDNVTLNGVVTRDLTGNQFMFLADDGRNFRVISRGNGENGVANGDRVQVQGRRNNREHDVINATSVAKINVANPGENFTLNGVVTRDLAGDEFLFRDDEGRAFRVVAPKGEPNWLSKDDRIEVRGRRDRNERDLIYADSVRPLKGSIGNPGENVTLNGAVTRDLPGNQFDFRSDDGLLFRVIARAAGENKLANGDRVEVSGNRDKIERDVIHADTVRPLKDGNQTSNSQFGVVTRSAGQSLRDAGRRWPPHHGDDAR